MLERFAARLRRYLQAETHEFLRAELLALRAEMQADRHAFQQAVETLRQVNDANLAAQAGQVAQMRKLFVELDVARLVETIDAAVLTLALPRDAEAIGEPAPPLQP